MGVSRLFVVPFRTSVLQGLKSPDIGAVATMTPDRGPPLRARQGKRKTLTNGSRRIYDEQCVILGMTASRDMSPTSRFLSADAGIYLPLIVAISFLVPLIVP